MNIPPPYPAELPEKVQLVTAGEEVSVVDPAAVVVGGTTVRVAAGDREAVEDGGEVQGQPRRMVEDVVAVVTVVGKTRPVVAIEVAAQDGGGLPPSRGRRTRRRPRDGSNPP